MKNNAPHRPRRSALYLPASNARAIEKAASLPADIIILDLEDAVAPDAKAQARDAAVAAVQAGGFGTREVAIRVNDRHSEWGMDDFEAAARSGADAVLVPKISSPDDVLHYHEAMRDAPAPMQLWAMIESCAAIGAIEQIAALAHQTRLSLFVLGTNDLAKEMHARLTPERTPFLPILTTCVVAARTHGLTILDGVCNEFRDLAAIQAEAEQGLMFGFDGKSLIHPAQIDPCNAVFSPSEEEIREAKAIIDAFALPENTGKGAIQVEGKMVELLHLDQAQKTLAIAETIKTSA